MKVALGRHGRKGRRRRTLAGWTPRALLRRVAVRLTAWGVRLMAWAMGVALRHALRPAFRGLLPRGLRMEVMWALGSIAAEVDDGTARHPRESGKRWR